MKRYNIFYQIHKGLRALMYETLIKLQQTDFADAADAEATLVQVEAMVSLFDQHAHTEDHFVLPAIARFEPAMVEAFEGEHEEDHALGQKISGAIMALRLALAQDARTKLGETLTQAVLEFTHFNLVHMQKEETMLNNLLWRYYDDAALHAITMDIIRNQPQDKLNQFNKWMMRGLSNQEIIGWLTQVKQTAPDFVFESFVGLTMSELPENRWQKILEPLNEGAMLA